MADVVVPAVFELIVFVIAELGAGVVVPALFVLAELMRAVLVPALFVPTKLAEFVVFLDPGFVESTAILRSGMLKLKPCVPAVSVVTVVMTGSLPICAYDVPFGAVRMVRIACTPGNTPPNDTVIGTVPVLLYTATLRMCEPVAVF